MQHIKWIDFNPSNYNEYNEKLKPVFKELLPNNSRKSFEYHFRKYNYLSLKLGLRDSFELEAERFKSYLIETYKLEMYY